MSEYHTSVLLDESVSALISSATGIYADATFGGGGHTSEIIRRLSGRRECSNCGRTYHIEHNKPSVDGKCDSCGAHLVCRKDDEPETIKNRLAVYHKQTEPLKEFYSKKGLLIKVDSQGGVAKTTDKVFEAMGVSL